MFLHAAATAAWLFVCARMDGMEWNLAYICILLVGRRAVRGGVVVLPGGHFGHELALERVPFGLLVGVDGRAQTVQYALGLVEVDGVERVPDLVLHLLDHAAYVGYVRRVGERSVLLLLAHERAAQVHHARVGLVRLQPEHDRRRQLVVHLGGRTALLHLDHVYGVPAALDLLVVAVARFLDEYDAGEAVLVVPEVDGRDAALEVHLAVLLEGRVGLDLEAAQAVRGLDALVERRLVHVAPRRAIRVAVAVIVAQQVVLADEFVARHLERLIDGAQQVLAQVGHQVDELRQVLLDLLRRQAAHQVEREVQLLTIGILRHSARRRVLVVFFFFFFA